MLIANYIPYMSLNQDLELACQTHLWTLVWGVVCRIVVIFLSSFIIASWLGDIPVPASYM